MISIVVHKVMAVGYNESDIEFVFNSGFACMEGTWLIVVHEGMGVSAV